jgi:hypothetical protein
MTGPTGSPEELAVPDSAEGVARDLGVLGDVTSPLFACP